MWGKFSVSNQHPKILAFVLDLPLLANVHSLKDGEIQFLFSLPVCLLFTSILFLFPTHTMNINEIQSAENVIAVPLCKLSFVQLSFPSIFFLSECF